MREVGTVNCLRSHSQEVVFSWFADTKTMAKGCSTCRCKVSHRRRPCFPDVSHHAQERASCPRGISSMISCSSVRNPGISYLCDRVIKMWALKLGNTRMQSPISLLKKKLCDFGQVISPLQASVFISGKEHHHPTSQGFYSGLNKNTAPGHLLGAKRTSLAISTYMRCLTHSWCPTNACWDT